MSHIKWCRQNLGERGTTWDFSGTQKLVFIEIYDNKALAIYKLKW